MLGEFAVLILFSCLVGEISFGNKVGDTLRCQIWLPDLVYRKWIDSVVVYEKKAREMFEMVKEYTEKYEEMRKGWEQMQKEKAIEMMKKSEEMRKIEEMLNEKMRKMLEKPEEMRKKVKELKMVGVERFDDTGLIHGDVKYFIRIWKHPPKEMFNMPTFKK